MEPIDSLPLILARLAELWPAEDEVEQGAPIPGLVDETN